MSSGDRTRLRHLLLGALIPLAGCGPGGLAGPDEGAILQSAGISSPASYPFHFPSTGGPPYLEAVAFEQAHEVSLAPTTAGPPWALFHAGDKDYQPGEETGLPVGDRAISSRSEVRTWKEGAVDHFAETVTYTITPNASLAQLGVPSLGPFSIRLTAENDPAVGHWVVTNGQIDPDAKLTAEEQAALDRALVALGQQHLGAYEADLARARGEAFAGIADRLAAQGTLEHDGKSPLVSFSRNNGLAYYIGPQSAADQSFNQMRAFCTGLKTLGYTGWRMGSLDELKALQGTDDYHKFIDTPDHRLLQALARETGGPTSAVILTGTTTRQNVYGAFYNPLTGPPAPDSTTELEGMRIGPQGETQQTPFALPAGPEQNSAPINRQGFLDLRVFCVAPLHH